MAIDVITLLEYVGWTAARRQLHVVGVSMGGMISLELASRIAPRIASLSLLVTTSGGWSLRNFTPFKGASGLVRLTFAKEPDDKVKLSFPLMYPTKWLNEPAKDYDRPDITNAEYLTPIVIRRINTTRKQTLVGALSQMAAAMRHYVSPARLRTISKSIPKIYIMTGDEDYLVQTKNSHHLKSCMSEAEFEYPDAMDVDDQHLGHGAFAQYPKRFGAKMDSVMQEGWARREA
ncbi:hypothetical protein FRB90_008169 [Tulasnella sp. 427]|nr:hypothetical protein FRB90_008169 [Tulasnella sp. 427]